MQIPSPELVRRIEALVSSLLGVTESRVEREPSGAIRSLRASVAPGHSPDRVRREIRSALLSSLDLELAPDVVDVKVEEQLGRRQEEFWEGPDRRRAEEVAAPTDTPEPPADEPTADPRGPDAWPVEGRRSPEDRRAGGDRRELPDRRGGIDRRSGSDRRMDAEGEESRSREAPEPEAGRVDPPELDAVRGAGGPAEALERRTPPEARGRATIGGGEPSNRGSRSHHEGPSEGGAPSASRDRAPGSASTRSEDIATEPSAGGSGSLLPLSLGEYILMGGGGDDVGVELRIRVVAGGDPFVGTVRVSSLEDVSPGLFVGATLRAVERALDARPVSERSARILILEAVDMEEVVLREGRFLAATVQAVHRDGESRATGLVPAEGRVLREAAAEAALDAVTRILQGRHTRRIEGRGRVRHRPESRSGGDGGERRGDGPARGRTSRAPGARGTMRDPFHVWE